MKRLLQISLDTLLASTLPIIMWLILGFIISKEISNVFSLTYPLQFFYMLFITLFAIGPNITSKKQNDINVIYSNMLFSCILVGIITIVLCFNVDSYIKLMSMSETIYHNFCLYSIVLMYYNFILQLLLQKLYYENNNKKVNKISLLFNLTNFLLIIILSALFKDVFAITVTLVIDFLILIILFINNIKRFTFILKIKENIKYTSFSLLKDISFLLI